MSSDPTAANAFGAASPGSAGDNEAQAQTGRLHDGGDPLAGQHAFLLELSDALLAASDPARVQAEAARALGERLGADRVAYYEIDGDDCVIEADWAPRAPSLAGRHPGAVLGAALVERHRQGQATIVVADMADMADMAEVSASAQASGAPQRRSLGPVEVAACVSVSLVRDARWVAGLTVHCASPRAWTAGEVETVRASAERTWAAVARGRAEAARRESAQRQAFLLQLSDALMPLTHPADIEATAARLLAERLHVGWCHLGEFDARGTHAVVHHGFHRDGLPSLEGVHDLSGDSALLALLHAGAAFAWPELASPGPAGPLAAAWYGERGVQSVLVAPLLRDGRLAAVLWLADACRRAWSQGDVELLEGAAQRTWAALQRARSEQAARNGERHYRTLFNSIDEGFCIIEMLFEAGRATDHIFVETNPVFEQQAGFSIVPGQRMREIVPDHDQFWFDVYGRVALTGEPARFEHQSPTSGNVYDVYAFRVEDPGLRRVAVLFRNITERRRAEQALRASEHRLRSVLDGMEESFGLLDRDLRVITLNKAALAQDGRTLDEIRGRLHTEVYPATDPAVVALYERALAEDRPVGLEHRYGWHDGRASWLEMRAFPVPEGLAIFWRDISERKTAEEKFRSFFDATNVALVILEFDFDEAGRPIDYRHVHVNPALQGISGLEPAQILGRRVTEMAPPQEAGEWLDFYAGVLGTGRPGAIERFSPALQRWIKVSAAPFGQGQVAAVFENTTLRKEAEAALAASERKFRKLFDSIDEGLAVVEMIHDGQGEIVDMVYRQVNAAYERQGGVYDVVGRSIFEVIPDVEEAWLDHYKTVAKTGQAVRVEGYQKDVDRWFEAFFSRIDDAGRFVAIVFADISARKRAETALRESEEQYRTLFETMHEGFAVMEAVRDAAGRVVDLVCLHANQAWQRQTGAPFLSGTNASDVSAGPGDPGWIAAWTQVAQTGKACREERYVAAIDRWYENHYWRIGGPGSDRVAAIVDDVSVRKRAEAVLRESEARHRLLLDSWAQAVWETDAEGVVVADSPSWRAHTGQTFDEWVGYGWLDAVHPGDRAWAERQWRQAVATRSQVNAEFRLRSPDGGWGWTNVRATPVLDAQGRIEKWAGLNIDIDASKRAQERLQLALDATNLAVYEWDLVNDAVTANQRFRDFFDARGPLSGAGVLQGAVHPGDRARVDAELARAMEAGASGRYAFEHRVATGGPLGERWVLSHGQVHFAGSLGDRRAVRLLGTLLEITERKQAEIALRESEERFRALATTGGASFYRVSPDWHRVFQLDSRVFVPSIDGPIDNWIFTHVLEEDRVKVVEAIADAMAHKGLFEVEHRLHLPDGSVGWLHSRAAPILDGKGDITEWFGTITDITQRQRDAEALRQSEERFRLAIQGSKITVAECDLDLRYTWIANPAPGWDPADIVGRTDAELLPAAYARRLMDFKRRALHGEGPLEEEAQGPPGTPQWFIRRAEQLRNAQGSVCGLRILAIDIHELKQVERSLRERESALSHSEATLRAVIEKAPLAMAFTGTSGEILLRNPLFDQLWGRPPHVTTALTYSEVYEGYHLGGRRIASEEWPGARAVLRGETIDNEVYEIVHADGRRITCWFASAPIRDAQGAIRGAVTVFRDVSEELRTAAALRQSEERNAFLVRFSDAVRGLSDPARVARQACRLLSEALGTDQTMWAVIDWTTREYVTDWIFAADGTKREPSRWPLDERDPFAAEHLAGKAVVYEDLAIDPLMPQAVRDAMCERGLRAGIAFPVLVAGRLAAVLHTSQAGAPRHWSAEEVSFVAALAHRGWAEIERARVQAALRQSEARLAAAFQSVPAGIAVTDAQARIVLANAEFRRFVPNGILPLRDPVLGARWQAWDAQGRVIAPHDYPGARALRGESVGGLEMLYTDDQGRAVWTSVATAPIVDDTGRVAGIASVISDITQRRRDADALRHSKAGLETELRRTTLLHGVATRSITQDNLPAVYAEVLSTAAAIMESDAGTIHIHEPQARTLVLLVTQGIPAGLAEHLHRIDAGSSTACGIALRTGARTFVDFDCAPVDDACRMHVDAGLRSAQATPLLSRDGSPIGMITTHWRASGHRPSHDQLRFLDLLARLAADLIEQRRAAASLRESEERLRQFGEASQDILWIRDAGTLAWTYLTPAFEGIYGLSRDDALQGDNFSNWLELVLPEDRPHARAMTDRVLAGELVSFEYRIRRPCDGSVRWLRDTDFPIRGAHGRIDSLGGIGQDVTSVKLGEERLRTSEERLRVAADVAKFALWDWNVQTGEVVWSDEHFRMNGYAVAEVTPSYDAWLARLHPEDRAATDEALRQARETRTEYVQEFRAVHPDGSVHWISARGRFFYDEAGETVRMVGAMLETTERREWEERQKVLVAELQHRTFNLMGMVNATAESTLRSSASLEEFGAKFRDRISALARVQRLLSRLSDEDCVTFDALLRSELDAVGVQGADRRVVLEGPDHVALRSRTVQTFAMALHELTTNAVKYGALKQAGARLAVRWQLVTREGAPWLEMDWRESGVSMLPIAGRGQGSGQGRLLIEKALPYQLRARTTYQLTPDGVHCTIALPVSARSAQGMAGPD